ncbi:MAG: copper resistance protein CopC [Chloroflexota bacterium]
MRRSFFLAFLLFSLISSVRPVGAHANLIRSEPAANATLASAPDLIRLSFTEPLEAQFSAITLRDEQGNRVPTPASAIDPTDPQVMTLVPGALPDGLYTVSWRSLSAADGHQASGSFAFVIGSSPLVASAQSEAVEAIPTLGAALRFFDLLSLSLAVGSLGFILFQARMVSIERRARRLIWLGWALVGIAGILLLPYQLSQATDAPLPEAFQSLGALLSASRFGQLWLMRTLLWLLLGVALWQRFDWAALIVGAVLLLTRSLNSHSSAMHDPLTMILGDWLHLLATVLWIGGLVQFASVAAVLRRDTAALGRLVGGFSNYARVCVALLSITGLFLAWMHVGSVEALLTTLYGRALLVKIILFLPLLAIAAVNLLVTHRRLQAGQAVWAGRLRGLLGAEIALTLGILAAVGVLTSANPARMVLAARQPPPDNTITQFQEVDGIHVHFDVAPGWVGENGFFVTLYQPDGTPINDASLIRVRLDNLTTNVGQSELRPQLASQDGEYSVTGANLSVPGQWRARVSIARPNEFDVLADFTLDMQLAPVPEGLDMRLPLAGHDLAEVLTGLALLALGAFAGVSVRFWRFSAVGLLATLIIVIGMLFVMSGAGHAG